MRTTTAMLSVAVVAMAAVVTQAADQRANLQVSQDLGGGSFEGRFCFDIADAIVGWEVIVEFSSPVRGITVIWLC